MRWLIALALVASPWTIAQPQSQAQVPSGGATLIVPAYGEVTLANDEARATFLVEEQDKDKAAAASRANRRMKEGMDILRREDPQAKLRTQGYYTTPVYAEVPPQAVAKPRPIVAWRVGQYVEATTTNLAGLPKTVAAAQRILALNGLTFGLSRDAKRRLDRENIEAAYRNLTERIAYTVHAMGRDPSDATIESVDLEGAGSSPPPPFPMRAAAMAAPSQAPVEEPSFEPGETTVQLRIVGRVKLR